MPSRPDAGNVGIVSNAELVQLVHALVRSGQPFTEDNVVKVAAWAAEVRVASIMLGFALDGTKALVVCENGEVALANNSNDA